MPQFGLKAGLSIVDQALISGAGFALHVLLARWLSPEEYGIFAIVFSVFLFLSGFHNALILEPMSVLAPSYVHERLSSYIVHSIYLHLLLNLAFALLLLLCGVGLIVLHNPMGEPLIGLIFAAPLMLLFWQLRRVCYLDGRVTLAVRASLLYGVLLLVGIWEMWRAGIATPFNAILVLGLSSAGASLLLLWLLRIEVRMLLAGCSAVSLTELFQKHWIYGKWVVGSSFVHWAGTAGYLPLIASLVGYSQAGALRAIQNLILPLQQVLAGLANLWLPSSAKLFLQEGEKSLKTNLYRMLVATVGVSLVYLTAIVAYSQPIMTFLYGSGQYDEYQWLNYYLAVFALIGVVSQGLSITLRALQRPDCVFYSQAGTAILTTTVGTVLVWRWELPGAVAGLILSALIGTVILVGLLKSSFRKA